MPLAFGFNVGVKVINCFLPEMIKYEIYNDLNNWCSE